MLEERHAAIAQLVRLGMLIVGLPCSHPGLSVLTEIACGAPYGATTIAGGDGSRQPSEGEPAGTHHQGELVTLTAGKLFA